MTAALLTLALLGAADKPSIAVLYFDNNTKSDELEVMRKGLADMMVTDLVAWDGVEVVEREKLEAVIGELKLQRTKYFDQSAAVKIGTFLQARYLLTGSMAFAGDKLLLDARVIDATANKAILSARATGPKDDIFPIEQELVEQVAAGIDVKLKNATARKRAKVPSLEALLAYSKALDLTDQGKVEEAEKAFAALVSKSPTFVLARERKAEIVKALEEYKKRQKEMVTASAVRVGQAADAALKRENEFAKLSSSDQGVILAMRRVKGHFLARVLKQYLSSRGNGLRAVLAPKKQQAVEAMRAWHANQLRYLDELEVYGRANASAWRSDLKVAPELVNDLTDASLGPYEIMSRDQVLRDLSRFIFFGRVSMGESNEFVMAPTWADLSPADAAAFVKAEDARIDAALKAASTASAEQRDARASAAISLLGEKAERLQSLGRDDEAVGVLQLILDTFPTDRGNASREDTIKKIVSDDRSDRERWQKALKGCDDMDIRRGSIFAVGDREKHLGVAGIDEVWNQLFKACPKAHSALDFVAKDLAMDAANFDDCELSKKYWRLYVEHGGSVGDMLGYHKNYVPWCEYGNVTRTVEWIKFTMDGHWTPNVDEGLMAVKSYDGKQLALSGRNETGSISLSLYLAPEGKGWKCRLATWRTRDGDQVDGTCSVKLAKEGAEKGDYDEGTFTAAFSFVQDGNPMKTELTEGSFRLRRE